MRGLKSAVAMVLCVLGVACSDAAHAQDMDQVFGLRVCNHTGITAALALSTHTSPDDPTWHVFGWYVVPRRDCKDIGYFPRSSFYYYAEERNHGPRYTYWGGDFPICVNYPGPFDRRQLAKVTCDEDELKQFTEVTVDDSTGIMTVNLR